MKLQVVWWIAPQRPGVCLLGILHDSNTSNPSTQRRKRIWYSGRTLSSQPSPRVHNSWNRRLVCNTYGAVNLNGSKIFRRNSAQPSLLSGAKTLPLKVRQSSDASHSKPRTMKDPPPQKKKNIHTSLKTCSPATWCWLHPSPWHNILQQNLHCRKAIYIYVFLQFLIHSWFWKTSQAKLHSSIQ